MIFGGGVPHALAKIRIDFDAERVGDRQPNHLDVGNPIGNVVDVHRVPGNHIHLEPVLISVVERTGKLEDLTHRKVGGDGVDGLANERRNFGNDRRRSKFVDDGGDKFLLALDATDIALGVSIANVGDGVGAVEMLKARVKIDDEPAVVIPRVLVIHALFDVDIDAADCVNEIDEGVSVDDDVVIDVDAEKIFDGALGQSNAAVGVSGIDFVEAAIAELDAGIARDRKQRGLIGQRVDGGDDERIGAPDVVFALVDAHNQDSGFVGDLEELLILLNDVGDLRIDVGQIFERVRGEHGAGDCGGEKACDEHEHGPKASGLFTGAAGSKRVVLSQAMTSFPKERIKNT